MPELGTREVGEGLGTAEERWRAAVASVPLESPRAFPTSMRPLVARLAGSAERAAYTTGPATRRALSAAGALGATTGSVVHLAAPPNADPASMGVLAHELSHARSPVTRPRFLLRDPGGAQDADERSARSVGDEVQAAARQPGLAVQRLFDGGRGALGGLRNRAAGIAGAAGDRVGSVASGVSDQVGSVGSRVGNAAGGVAGQAGAISAGLVENLRVGGAGAAGVVDAVRAAGAGVQDSATGAVGDVADAGGEVDARARAMLAQLEGLASNAGAQAGQAADDAMSTVDGGVDGVMAQGQGLVNQAQGALAGGAAGLANRAAGALGSAAGLAAGDLDKIVEALEERLLRELERRGGRYAGVF